jgi:hypothetical protein
MAIIKISLRIEELCFKYKHIHHNNLSFQANKNEILIRENLFTLQELIRESKKLQNRCFRSLRVTNIKTLFFGSLEVIN